LKGNGPAPRSDFHTLASVWYDGIEDDARAYARDLRKARKDAGNRILIELIGDEVRGAERKARRSRETTIKWMRRQLHVASWRYREGASI
jgi:hypothetical protein